VLQFYERAPVFQLYISFSSEVWIDVRKQTYHTKLTFVFFLLLISVHTSTLRTKYKWKRNSFTEKKKKIV